MNKNINCNYFLYILVFIITFITILGKNLSKNEIIIYFALFLSIYMITSNFLPKNKSESFTDSLLNERLINKLEDSLQVIKPLIKNKSSNLQNNNLQNLPTDAPSKEEISNLEKAELNYAVGSEAWDLCDFGGRNSKVNCVKAIDKLELANSNFKIADDEYQDKITNLKNAQKRINDVSEDKKNTYKN